MKDFLSKGVNLGKIGNDCNALLVLEKIEVSNVLQIPLDGNLDVLLAGVDQHEPEKCRGAYVYLEPFSRRHLKIVLEKRQD